MLIFVWWKTKGKKRLQYQITSIAKLIKLLNQAFLTRAMSYGICYQAQC